MDAVADTQSPSSKAAEIAMAKVQAAQALHKVHKGILVCLGRSGSAESQPNADGALKLKDAGSVLTVNGKRWCDAVAPAALELAFVMAGSVHKNSFPHCSPPWTISESHLTSLLLKDVSTSCQQLAVTAHWLELSDACSQRVWSCLKGAATTSIDLAEESATLFLTDFRGKDPVPSAWTSLTGAGLSPLPYMVLPADTELPHVWLPAFATANAAVQWCTLRSVQLLAERVMPQLDAPGASDGMVKACGSISKVVVL